jgi:hypothetical protein
MEWAQAVFRMKSWYIALVMLAAATAITACNGISPGGQGRNRQAVTDILKPNIVRIEARLGAEGRRQDGFGFVVSEESDQLYIVTANHVVRGDERNDNDIDNNPTVIFFRDQATEKGKLLDDHLHHGRGGFDLAMLRVKKPPGFNWNRHVLARDTVKFGDEMWFIGRGGKWFVPPQPSAVSEVTASGSIRVDKLPVNVGTSGAPLISEYGLVGMIVIDTGIYSEATSLDVIQRAIKGWGFPWQLEMMRSVSDTRRGGSIGP